MLRALGVAAGLLVIGVGVYVIDTAVRLNAFEDLKPSHFDGTCQPVTGAVGAEDLTIDPRSGIVYVSAYDRYASDTGNSVGGAIYAYDPNATTPSLVPLTPSLDPRFHPHGISLWIGEDGKASLFVVNHPFPGTDADAHTIEILDFQPDGTLATRATLRDRTLLVTPNDIVAVGPDRFYVTNTQGNAPGGAQALELLLRRSQARLVYYDGAKFSAVLEPRRYLNGINVSRDGRQLYLAETTPQNLLVYDRDPATESLTLTRTIELGTGPDNIEIGENGELWIGAHPKPLATLQYLTRAEPTAPSQVLRVSPDGQIEEVYLNDGTQISALSTAAARGNRLFFGQVAGDGILDCRRGS
jgi:arylesterase / paraoxonase